MKTFNDLQFDLAGCQKETLELQNWLEANPNLEENKDILPFFRARPQLAALCGCYEPHILAFDRQAWEYDLFGDFSCDLVIGDSESKAYCFIEFEDAGPRSLFVPQGQKSTREWSPRFDHGYSQIIDWFYKLEDRGKSDEFESRFGKRVIDFTGILVVGRNQHLKPGEALRLEWRRRHVIVHSRRIDCVTFDDLLRNIQRTLARFTHMKQTPPGSGAGPQTRKGKRST